MMADMPFVQEFPVIDAGPGVHHKAEHFGLFGRIDHTAIISLVIRKTDELFVHLPVLFNPETGEIGFDKIQIAHMRKFVKGLEHVVRHKIIRLQNTDILSSCGVDTDVHRVTVAGILL